MDVLVPCIEADCYFVIFNWGSDRPTVCLENVKGHVSESIVGIAVVHSSV